MKANFRTFVVVNPTAGSNAVASVWREIIQGLRDRIPEVEFALTERSGHATELTRRALRDGFEQIVSVGGDGTNFEVVNGFFEPLEDRELSLKGDFLEYISPPPPLTPINRDAVLGLLPFGTGGDLRRTLGISHDLVTNLDRLMGRNTKKIDVGEIAFVSTAGDLTSRLFLNIASGGLSGRVVQLANKTWKSLGRGLTFSLTSLVAWSTWRNQPVHIRIDGEERPVEKMVNVVAANGEYFGGGMHVAKGASLVDGYFDVIIFKDIGKLRSLYVLSSLYSAKHLTMDKVEALRARQIHIGTPERKRKILLDIDGEDLGGYPAIFTIHPKALNLKI